MNIFSKFLLIIIIFLFSCTSNDTGTPKPRTYPRVEFPQKKYNSFISEKCNFKFEHPVYSKVIKEKKFFNKEAPNECWYNIVFPMFNGKIYLTYYPINNRKEFDNLVNDSFLLISKHDSKASGRKEFLIHEKENVSGVLFKINGNVASQTQFFLTDSVSNFIRGSLYFNNKVNPDSIRIIQEFIDLDIDHLIKTFDWN